MFHGQKVITSENRKYEPTVPHKDLTDRRYSLVVLLLTSICFETVRKSIRSNTHKKKNKKNGIIFSWLSFLLLELYC